MRHLKAILIALIILTFTAPAIAAELAPGLVGYWRMESETGGDTPDSSGAGKTGTVEGATLGEGLRGKGYNLDGGDDFISFGSFNVGTIHTILMWGKLDISVQHIGFSPGNTGTIFAPKITSNAMLYRSSLW